MVSISGSVFPGDLCGAYGWVVCDLFPFGLRSLGCTTNKVFTIPSLFFVQKGINNDNFLDSLLGEND